MEDGSPDSEVLFEEDVWEIDDEDAERPPEDDLQEEMEGMGFEEEEDEDEEMVTRNDAAAVFKAHTGSVFCVSLHPDGALACSGGEDDRAFLWRTDDASVAMECKGHKDSVTCTGFSHDGKYAATGDMGGGVRVWSVEERQPVCVLESSDIEWLKWHPQAHVLLAGTSDGMGWMWRVPGGDCKTFQAQSSRNICSSFLPDGKHIACGYEDGGVRVWNLRECVTTSSMSPAHEGPVNCLAANSDGSLVMTGSEDSTARLVSTTTGKVVVSLAAGMPREVAPTADDEDKTHSTPSSVEDVAFFPSLPLALTASLSGAVGVWDIATQKLRHTLQHQAGVVRLRCSSRDPLVFTGCLDGGVRLWDVRGGECVREWWGHTNDILDLTIASDDSLILSASDDATVLVFSNKSQTL
jgi:WD40 repeat protein